MRSMKGPRLKGRISTRGQHLKGRKVILCLIFVFIHDSTWLVLCLKLGIGYKLPNEHPINYRMVPCHRLVCTDIHDIAWELIENSIKFFIVVSRSKASKNYISDLC